MHQKIHARLHHAVPFHNVEKTIIIILQFVHVYQIILAPHPTANPSVLLTQIAQMILLVRIRDVKILVWVHVVMQRNVWFQITMQIVSVLSEKLAIPSLIVLLSLFLVRKFYTLNCSIEKRSDLFKKFNEKKSYKFHF